MLRCTMLALGALVACPGLAGEPIGTVYDLRLRYEHVELIELAPGVEVPSDMWEDGHVVTVGDLVSVGMAYDDAVGIVEPSRTVRATVPCTWSRLNWCIELGIPLGECCGRAKETG